MLEDIIYESQMFLMELPPLSSSGQLKGISFDQNVEETSIIIPETTGEQITVMTL